MTVLTCTRHAAEHLQFDEVHKKDLLSAADSYSSSFRSSSLAGESSQGGDDGHQMASESGECVLRTNCLENPMRRLFFAYGRYIAKHPYIFLTIPLMLAAILSCGLYYFELRNDTEYLVTPKNGPAKQERRVLQKYFHLDQRGGYLPDRAPILDGFNDVIYASTSGDNLFTQEGIQQMIDLDVFIRDIKVYDDEDKPYKFQDICATWKEKCIDHPILLLFERDASLVPEMTVTYPIYNRLFLGQSLGNVTVDQNTSVVLSAQALRITFFVRYETQLEQALANRWLSAIQLHLQEYQTPNNTTIYHNGVNSLTDQFDQASSDIAPKFAAPFILLIIFSVMSCMMNDWVRSKPSLALAGVLSAGLGLASSFGLLSALGIRAVPQAGLVPFLALGVGVDNMFILISSWRRSDTDVLGCLPANERVQLRMALTMKEAALSITITSVTDVLAFGIGAITDFPTVELFCLYTGLAIVMGYIFCITFFAALMSLSGRREEQNRHCVTMCRVLSVKESEEKGWWYRVFCAGGKSGRHGNDAQTDCEDAVISILPSNQGPIVTSTAKLNQCTHGQALTPEEPPEANHIIMRFFRDRFAPMLMTRWAKAIVIITWLTYLGIAIYGCFHMRRGVSFEKLSNVGSYLADYYKYKEVYFNKFGPSVSVMVDDEDLEYSNPDVQKKIFTMLERFENNTAYFYKPATISWLTNYLMFLEHLSPEMKPKTEAEFVDILKNHFLKFPGPDIHKVDISFSEDGTRIIASRFYVQSLWYERPEDIMLEARKMAASVKELHVTTFHSTFVYFDQPVVVWDNTLQNILIAIVCMFVIAILFVPHPISALWVTIATASIEAGVIGFMTLWGVNVDFISMTYLILCIGFSVDFSVHITYGFIASEKPNGREKAIDALFHLGYPITQSGISTLLAISFISTSISYLFFSFFKTMFLVIMFGVAHGLFVLPVLLSILNGGFDSIAKEKCSKPNCSGEECKNELKETKRMVAEKGKHLLQQPLLHLAAGCEKCQEEGGAIVIDKQDQVTRVTEVCSVV